MPDFFETSKEIANDFLQNIVFIDDKAFNFNGSNSNHDFDAYRVTKAFMTKQKLCAIYNPKTLEDINHLAILAKNADITVLDWQIILEEEQIPQGHEEEDAEIQEPRGSHTLKIIKEILSDNSAGQGSLKLILVYTGEIILTDITSDIYNALREINIIDLTTSFCEVSTKNVKILIVAKPDNELDENGQLVAKFNHNPQLNERVISYDQLPDFILDEFAKMTSGLLSNFALQSLTVLRKNTFKFLSLYNNKLDFAFLMHRLSLPDQHDAQEQLIEIFSRSVEDLLNYHHVGNSLGLDIINKWVDTKGISKRETINGNNIQIDNTFIKKWATEGFIAAISEVWNANNYGHISNNLKENFKKKFEEICKKGSSSLLNSPNNEINDIQFSILTHHKSIFKPHSTAPKLTLGTVIKGTKSNYLVCIQQKCDSVRINDIRKFLFLPITELQNDSTEKFNFTTPDSKKLKLKNKSYNIKTIKFQNAPEEDVIRATEVDGKYLFYPIYKDGHEHYDETKDEVYEWIFDLKDLHAQRISNDFARELSRVGLDESEWLRRWAT